MRLFKLLFVFFFFFFMAQRQHTTPTSWTTPTQTPTDPHTNIHSHMHLFYFISCVFFSLFYYFSKRWKMLGLPGYAIERDVGGRGGGRSACWPLLLFLLHSTHRQTHTDLLLSSPLLLPLPSPPPPLPPVPWRVLDDNSAVSRCVQTKNIFSTYYDDRWWLILWKYRIDPEHILRCIEILHSRLMSIRRCMEIRYSWLRSILICITMLYRSLCLPVCPAFFVSAVARALPWCCLVFRTHVSLRCFYLKIHCRKCSM